MKNNPTRQEWEQDDHSPYTHAWSSAAEAAISAGNPTLLDAVLSSAPAGWIANSVGGKRLLTRWGQSEFEPYNHTPIESRRAVLATLVRHGVCWRDETKPALKSPPFEWLERHGNLSPHPARKMELEQATWAWQQLSELGLPLDAAWSGVPLIHQALHQGQILPAIALYQAGARLLGKHKGNPCHAFSDKDAETYRIDDEKWEYWLEQTPTDWWLSANKQGVTAVDALKQHRAANSERVASLEKRLLHMQSSPTSAPERSPRVRV